MSGKRKDAKGWRGVARRKGQPLGGKGGGSRPGGGTAKHGAGIPKRRGGLPMKGR